jgi:hypothetical protein
MSILTWFASAKIKILEWAAGIGAVIAALAYVFIKGRSDGEAAGKLDAATQTAKENEKSLEQLQDSIKTSTEIETSIKALPLNEPDPPIVDGVVTSVVKPDDAVQLSQANPNSSAGRLNALARGGIVIVTMWLTGCTPQVITKTDFCGTWKPIIPSSNDRMTQSTSDQILEHDCRGYRLNCWDPPGIETACKGIGGK